MTAPDDSAPRRTVLTTDRMAYGAQAVGREGGKVIFVRGGAPDEEVEVAITEDRRSYAYAEVVDVRRRSPARREPPCPYLPRCGGCPWQHLEYGAQLEAKASGIAEQLRRLGGIEVPIEPIVPSPSEFGYRQRLKLRVEGQAVGFYAGASHTLVPIDDCLLAEPLIREAIPWVRTLLASVRARVRRLEILAGAGDGRVVVAGEVEGELVGDDESVGAEWRAAHPRVAGLVLGGRRWRRVWGEDRITVYPLADMPLIVRAGTFTQVNRAANERLVAAVLEAIGAADGLRVLDLYAGAGNFALPLARRGAAVTAVEQHSQAVEDGIANARRLDLAGCRFVRADVARFLHTRADAGEPVDLALLDPPRSGAAAILPSLLRLAPPRLCYVSCDLATLARDLKVLSARYRIDRVRPFDLFPHTYHVETVTTATLTC